LSTFASHLNFSLNLEFPLPSSYEVIFSRGFFFAGNCIGIFKMRRRFLVPKNGRPRHVVDNVLIFCLKKNIKESLGMDMQSLPALRV
jgi:hypothetical protein